MFKTLRMKLMLGFLPLLAILIGLGLWAIAMFYGLGGNIDVILRENYRSVLAVERMKEALERMDSGLMFAFSGRAQQAREQFDKSKEEFDRQLGVEQHNITVPGEQELVNELTAEYRSYLDLAADYFDLHNATTAQRTDVYFSRLLPKFENLRRLEDRVLLLNQRNMEQMNEKALRNAASSTRLMIAALLVAVVLAIASSRILTRLILEPIVAVTEGARAVSQGNLDQVVPATTKDELGELGQAFNAMARTIREYREAGTVRLLRAQKTAQATIDSFPDPVIVVDPEGGVERANPAAQRLLQAIPASSGDALPWIAPAALKPAARFGAGRAGRLPALEPGASDLPARRQPGPLLSASGAADPQRFGRVAGGRGRPFRRDQVSPPRPAQERHDLDGQPRIEDAAHQPADGRASTA